MSQEYRWLKNAAKKLPYSLEVSLANRIALAENVWHLLMSAIYGANSLECFVKLMPNGSWQRMCQGYCQVKMDGFLDEFLETWPRGGALRSGIVSLPTLPVPNFGVSVSHLWPRPIASDSRAWIYSNRQNPRISIVKTWRKSGQDRPIYDFMWNGLSVTQAAEFHEMMMGFPPGWTDLNA